LSFEFLVVYRLDEKTECGQALPDSSSYDQPTLRPLANDVPDTQPTVSAIAPEVDVEFVEPVSATFDVLDPAATCRLATHRELIPRHNLRCQHLPPLGRDQVLGRRV